MPDNDGKPVAVVFSASMDMPATRTEGGGNKWQGSDEVGLFMLATGGSLAGDIVNNADNRLFVAIPINSGSEALLDPADPSFTIYYPHVGRMDFIAYYPYKTKGTGGISSDYRYPVDVTDQSSPAALDLLYAKRTNVPKSPAAVVLPFEHQLSKLTLLVKRDNSLGNADFTALSATITGMPATASFNLDNRQLTPGSASPIQMLKVSTAANEATFEAILIPTAAGAGRQIAFTTNNYLYLWDIPADVSFEKGRHYTYTLRVRG
jgi:endonuclease G